MNKTLEWVRSMEMPGGGLSAWQDGYKAPSYPECTGYMIPTLYDYGEGKLAGRCADWLLSIQNKDGSWNGINNIPQTFDTAAIVEGLRRAHFETGKIAYKRAYDRALQWLWDVKGEKPFLPTKPRGETRVYTARAAWIMDDFESAEYWHPNSEWDIRWGEQERPHYIAYMLEGLFYLGHDITKVLIGTQKIEGLLPFYASHWNRVVGTDTSATIQMAILYQRVKSKDCLFPTIPDLTISHLLPAIQEMVTPNGGLRHSADETRMTIWTAKYYLDLLRLL